MKFAALVSGGKDSCFNILHCLTNGHELVALANLYPENINKEGEEEIDSFMYQTVGFKVLSHYEECIGVPMYRHPITGSSRNVDLQYEVTSNDETEDLYNLLFNIKTDYPDLEAISVGAILSTYQRIRVENVCQRLGLVSLAYLWNRDQKTLMYEMCQCPNFDARILKVAAFGLNQNHLEKSLQEMYPLLCELNEKFDIHICGEGGEFETIVLDAPFFIKKKIVIKEKRVIRHLDDDVYYMKLVTETVDKENTSLSLKNTDWSQFITEQPILNETFKEIEKTLDVGTVKLQKTSSSVKFSKSNIKVSKSGNKLFISNLSSDSPTIEQQTHDIFRNLTDILSDYSISSTKSIMSTNLLVSSMADFSKINQIYSSYFPFSLPPSRTCIETTLPKGTYLRLSCIVLLIPKIGLHVQGRSYWAPANIGPYSQACWDEENKFANLAGQIPLIPSSMELITGLKATTLLSLKHIVSVKDIIGFNNFATIVCYVTDLSYLSLVKKVFLEYSIIDHDENFSKSSLRNLLIVSINNLPKNSNIEWSGISYKRVIDEEDSEDEAYSTISEKLEEVNEVLGKQQSLVVNNKEFVSTLYYENLDELKKLISAEKKLHYIIYSSSNIVEYLNNHLESFEFIPVNEVHNSSGDKMEFGVIVRGSLD